MKTFSFLKMASFITVLLLALGCQKEMPDYNSIEEQSNAKLQGKIKGMPVTRAYHDHFNFELKVLPDFASGWTPADPEDHMWFYGTGDGNATHMGNAGIYFNTYTMRNADGAVIVYHAPVNMFYATEVQPYNVGMPVTAIVFDDKGNSIWFKIAPEGWLSWHIDATNVAMQGKTYIVGGTGKFAGATGETDFYAEFNQITLLGSMSKKGWIRY